MTGEDLIVRINFKENKKIADLNFGMAIFNQEGVCIFGINTFNDKIDTKNSRTVGFFEITCEKITLRANAYYVQAGLWGEMAAKNYDYLSKSKTFRVFTEDKNIGVVNLKYSWK